MDKRYPLAHSESRDKDAAPYPAYYPVSDLEYEPINVRGWSVPYPMGLARIARRLGLSPKDLAAVNPALDVSKDIPAGTWLELP